MTFKRLFVFIALFTFGAIGATTTQAQDAYTLQFNVKNFDDSVAFLAFRYGNKNMLQDTAVVKGGKVVFTGKKQLPGGVYSLINQKKEFLFEFLVDKEQNFSVSADSKDLMNTVKYSGSKLNDQFATYREVAQANGMANQALGEKMKALDAKSDEYKKLLEEQKANSAKVVALQDKIIAEMPGSIIAYILKAQTEPEIPEEIKEDQLKSLYYFRNHFWDNIDFTDDRIVRTPIYHNKIDKYFSQLTVQSPDSVLVQIDNLFSKIGDNEEFYKYTFVYLYEKYNSSKIMCIDKVFVHLVMNYYTKERAFWATDKQLKKIRDRATELSPIRCGEVAPNMRLLDTTYNWVTLYDVKSDWTLLVFWDPNCGHCKTDIPWLRERMDSLEMYGIEVFAVTTQQDEPDWRKFIQDHDLIWINATDVSKGDYVFWNNFREVYDIFSTPKIFLLDKEKTIRAKGFGSQQLFEVFEGVLKEEELRKKQSGNSE